MPQQASERNPFMLMLNPEVVLAAIEKSERLGKLNRRLCRPLDRLAGPAAVTGTPDVSLDDCLDADDLDEAGTSS
jgi:hypothetical protein